MLNILKIKIIVYFKKDSFQFPLNLVLKICDLRNETTQTSDTSISSKTLRTGVLSGTLSLAFNQLNMDPTMPFSEAFALASAVVLDGFGGRSASGRNFSPVCEILLILAWPTGMYRNL